MNEEKLAELCQKIFLPLDIDFRISVVDDKEIDEHGWRVNVHYPSKDFWNGHSINVFLAARSHHDFLVGDNDTDDDFLAAALSVVRTIMFNNLSKNVNMLETAEA